KAKKGTEAEIASTSAALEASETSREALIERVSNVERRATAAAENASRPLVDPWAAAATAAAVALGLAAMASVLAGRRRDRSAGGPDDVVPGRA
ncbi:MAG: hypothetical protein ACXWH5_14570, partial [Actinomycetota bacterium]